MPGRYGRLGEVFPVAPGDCLVVKGADLQASAQDADEPAGQSPPWSRTLSQSSWRGAAGTVPAGERSGGRGGVRLRPSCGHRIVGGLRHSGPSRCASASCGCASRTSSSVRRKSPSGTASHPRRRLRRPPPRPRADTEGDHRPSYLLRWVRGAGSGVVATYGREVYVVSTGRGGFCCCGRAAAGEARTAGRNTEVGRHPPQDRLPRPRDRSPRPRSHPRPHPRPRPGRTSKHPGRLTHSPASADGANRRRQLPRAQLRFYFRASP